MKVFVVFYEVPFEFGVIIDICATKALAEKVISEQSDQNDGCYEIQEWNVNEE